MRRQLIEALAYPHILVLANLRVENCPRNGFFDPAQCECRHCDQGEECRWLSSNDEFSVLAQKPTASIYESLLFCIDFVDAQNTRLGHNVRRCACESCSWLRDAARLAREYRDFSHD